jgi:hypothetical protein
MSNKQLPCHTGKPIYLHEFNDLISFTRMPSQRAMGILLVRDRTVLAKKRGGRAPECVTRDGR